MTLQEMLAIEEIKLLRAKYSHYCDSLDLEKYLSLFTEDAVLEADEKHGGVIRGKKELRELVGSMMRIHKKYQMFHLVSNPLIEILDEDHGRGRWYLLDYNFRFEEEPFRVACVYLDEYRKVDGVWKFSHIRLAFLYPYRWPEEIV